MAFGTVRALLKRPWVWGLAVLLAVLFALDHYGYRSLIYTPGDRFRAAMKEREAECKKHGPRPAFRGLDANSDELREWQVREHRCALLRATIDDWQATAEGRFAHAIKIPNPVPEDSGYRWWMRPRDYFKHLCENEAGEFIFKTVDDVEGIMQIRPRETGIADADSKGSKYRHLYAMEDPYGHWEGEVAEPAYDLVRPTRYAYFELPAGSIQLPEWKRSTAHLSQFDKPKPNDTIERYFGYTGRLSSLEKQFDTKRRARYGFTWRGIKRPHDREMGIAGGELIVLDLETNEVLAVRRGYALYAGQWQLTPACPKYGYEGGWDKFGSFTYWFVGKVVRPPRWKESRGGPIRLDSARGLDEWMLCG
jgi:hypothetical protein